ncbi:MAG: hypothetical protein ACPGVG_20585, partial [Mycobacterium sp.]
MRRPSSKRVSAMMVAGLAAIGLLTPGSVSAEPLAPGSPGAGEPLPLPPAMVPIPFAPPSAGAFPGPAREPFPAGVPAGQNPMPYLGEPVFAPPTFNPVNGSMVGVAKPIVINFQRRIADRQL